MAATAPRQPVDGVEVVVDGDPADAHRVGDLLDGAAQRERAALVEQAHGPLLVLAAERRAGGRRARPRRRRSAGRARRATAACARRRRRGRPRPAGRRSARCWSAGTSVAPTASTTGWTASEQRVLAELADVAHRSSGSRARCSETWVAPLANAARATAATRPGMTSSSARQRRAERTELDVDTGGRGGVDGGRDVGPRPALDERLDGELELLHGTDRTASARDRRPGHARAACLRATAGVGDHGGCRDQPPHGCCSATARLLHSVPAASKASFIRASAGSNERVPVALEAVAGRALSRPCWPARCRRST